MINPLLPALLQWASKLRFPTLFKIAAALFALSLLIPDPVPFLDELLLGLATLLFANWKNRKLPARKQPGARAEAKAHGTAPRIRH